MQVSKTTSPVLLKVRCQFENTSSKITEFGMVLLGNHHSYIKVGYLCHHTHFFRLLPVTVYLKCVTMVSILIGQKAG